MHIVYFGQSSISIDEDDAYRSLCSRFKEVNAAGGLARNDFGEYLVIKRGGLWDLPKGHQEFGEDISLTALREVREETGASNLELGGLLCITDHCYFRDGIWHLKHTWWYDMKCRGDSKLTPQTEEDITQAVWIKEEQIPECMKNTYPSIKEVFSKTRK